MSLNGFQVAFARKALPLARRVLAGEDFNRRQRVAIARIITHTLSYQEPNEPETPEIRILEEALLDLQGVEKAMSAGGER